MKFNIELDLDKNFVISLKDLELLYGSNIINIDGFTNERLNFTNFINNFIDTDTVADATIDGNANSGTKDINTLLSDMIKPHTKLLSYNKIFYELNKKYGLSTAREWLIEEITGGFYLHNAASSSFKPYCFAYDLDEIVEKGLFFVDKFKTGPAKHLTTFNDHVLEFISWASNRSSGAVGLPSYFLYSYYFWKNDVENEFYLKNPDYYRRQCFQKFIFDLNQPYLRITECAFTNVSIMDREYLTALFGDRTMPNGEYAIDYIDGIIDHQKVFMEVVSEIRHKQFMTFPVITYALLYQNGKFVDEEFARWANKHNMKWYDANMYTGRDVSVLSNCCRLLSDTKNEKLTGFINSIGGTSLKIGSAQVNTINLRRIVLEIDQLGGKTKDNYLSTLARKVELCIKVLDVIRSILARNIEKGVLPNYSNGLIEMSRQYNTIGATAMYETIRDFGFIETDEFGNKYYSKEGLEFAIDILDTINRVKDSFNFEYSINVEFVPGERCNVVCANKDAILFGNKYNDFIYSNQWIPLMEQCTLVEKIKLGAILDVKCGGGQISHINIDGDFANEEMSWNLLNKIAEEGVIYFAYNRKTSVCEDGHGFFGDYCHCGKPKSDEYSRVVGFLVGRNSYSKERKKEFDKRQWFNL